MSLKNPVAAMIENLTADAADNMYTAEFEFPSAIGSGLDSLATQMKYRVTGGLKIPDAKAQTYKTAFMGGEMSHVSAGTAMTHELSFQVRMDARWNCYTALKAWQSIHANPNTFGSAVLGPNVSSAQGKIKVYALATQINATSDWAGVTSTGAADGGDDSFSKKDHMLWQYNQVEVVEVGEPTFTPSSNGKQFSCTVKVIFGTVSYPTEVTTVS